MDLYAQTIVDDLVKYTKDAKALCTMINLCSADSKRVLLNENMIMMKKIIIEKVISLILFSNVNCFC